LGGRNGHIKAIFRGLVGGNSVRGAILHIEMAEKWAEMDKNGVETGENEKKLDKKWNFFEKIRKKKASRGVKRVEMDGLQSFFEGF
jgi:hypothetical protein